MNHLFSKLLLLSVFIGSTSYSVSKADLLVGSWPSDSIRRYDDDGNYISDFVAPGVGGLDLPDGMAFGADGHLYVASSNSNQVLRYSRTGEFIDAFVDSGLNAPGNLQFGPDGFLYVCNKNTGQVLRFDPDSGSLESIFASGGGLIQPVGLLWKDGLLYVSDFVGVIRRYDAITGEYVDDFANVASPLILNLDSDGNILVSSCNATNIIQLDCNGLLLGNFLTGGPISCPVGHLFNQDGQILVASWGNNRLLRYDAKNGNYIGEFSSGFGLLRPNDLLPIAPLLLGDINLDGTVDLLDVAPFIELLTKGDFQVEADTNEDGKVDLLDVAPFVELLVGQ